MSKQQVEKALHKIYQTLLFKDEVKFRVEVEPNMYEEKYLVYSIAVEGP